jgi:NAD(P)-dependent dehydrogenase (short-subunit alcohol dehydrogenase family)
MNGDTRAAQKVAIVTGAGHATGIGAASAEALRNQGYTVITFDLQGADRSVDVTDPQQVAEAIQAVATDFGQLDALVNNAGVGVGSAHFLEQTSDDLDLTLAVNVKGLVHCCQAAIPHMLQTGGGAIVNVASLCGLRALPAIPHAYTASKFAVVGLTKSMALEFGPNHIRVNAVCPGSVDTQMRAKAIALLAEQEGISMTDAEALETATISLGKAATPSEVATVVAFLCSAEAAQITGAAIPVDGGMTGGF